MMDKLLTVAQFAKHVHMSERTICHYVRDGVVEAYRIKGARGLRIPERAVQALLQPVEVASKPEKAYFVFVPKPHSRTTATVSKEPRSCPK